ncbi:ABC transporter permease [Streptomyces sp. AJS327]|uniref:ABC transporter permease n=1 Tax=Streptomyces sp. AJS327 TaxID=2545265 RepID=UPI0015DF1534|nr:ABC transporter permease [Streptomyces sp. AJS327]MBA0049909.1 ABC transporter permease [Streptomyces sp. AJS327]
MARLTDYPVFAARGVRLNLRNPDALITALVLPVMLMLVFVYLFGGALEDTTGSYVTYVAPAVLVLCSGYGASMTATSVTNDMTTGVIDRFRSMDASATAVLAGHVAASLVRNTLAILVVLAVALAIGFRPQAGPLEWGAALAVLLLYVTVLSWLGAAAGLLARSVEAASGFTFLVLFLPYPSSAFVPVETMPGWLHGFAQHQPVTSVIESLRALLLGQPVGNSAWTAVAWCVGLLLLTLPLCAALFQRRAR